MAWATPVDLAPVHGQRIRETQRSVTDQGLLGSGLVPSGSLIVSTRAPIGYVAETEIPMAFNQGCRGLLPLRPVDIRYFRYQFAALTSGLQSLGQGSTFQELSTEALASIRVVCPPEWEQRAIADFLDQETARIDALIAAKRRMIEVLGERRRAAIESRLWIGHLVQLKRVAELQAGYTFASEDFSAENEGPRLLRGINVAIGNVRWDEVVRLRHGMSVSSVYDLRQGDLVLGMDRPFVSGGTRVAAIGSGDEGSLLVQRVCRVRPRTWASTVILGAALSSHRFAAYIEPDLTGVSVPHLSEEQIGAYLVPALDSDRDEEVAMSIVAANEQFSALLDPLSRQIELLVEHRQALITAAVTGELSVPGVAA